MWVRGKNPSFRRNDSLKYNQQSGKAPRRPWPHGCKMVRGTSGRGEKALQIDIKTNREGAYGERIHAFDAS